MLRLLGVLLIVLVLYAILMGSFYETAWNLENHRILSGRLGFYGIVTLGVGVLIISGGIDLSIGSLVALAAVCFGLLMKMKVQPLPAAAAVVAGSALIGVYHGLLVTKLQLPPFLVTLCGLFMYRGVAQWLAAQSSVQLPFKPGPDDDPAVIRFWEQVQQFRQVLVSGNYLGVSNNLLLLLLIAGVLAVLLHGSVYGRYLYAIGCNEQAARYAGIATGRYKVLGYVICSTLSGVAGVLYLLEYEGIQPTSGGSLLELYAITGAVLGGCSLRGGEGTIPGMLLGAAVLPLLAKICISSRYIGSDLEWTVIGTALLLGTITNELVARRSAARAG